MQNLEKVAFGRAKVSNLFGGAVKGNRQPQMRYSSSLLPSNISRHKTISLLIGDNRTSIDGTQFAQLMLLMTRMAYSPTSRSHIHDNLLRYLPFLNL
jgi:hypothetical protein